MLKDKSLPHNGVRIVVLVADSTPLTAGLMAEALRRDRTLTVVATEKMAVLTAATNLRPDIVLLSEKLQTAGGKRFAVLKRLREIVPETRTILLLDSEDREVVVEAFRSGARGVFSRDEPLKMLNRCVRQVYHGQLWASDQQLEYLLAALAAAPAPQLVDANGTRLLSNHEEAVVRCLARGLTNLQIARELKVTQNTVKNYLFRIFNKLGVSSRVEVVLYAADQYRRAVT